MYLNLNGVFGLIHVWHGCTLYGALDWDWGGGVIPRSIQWMVFLQGQRCRPFHLEEDNDDDDIIANDEETINE